MHPGSHVLSSLLAMLNDKKVGNITTFNTPASDLAIAWTFHPVCRKYHNDRSDMQPIVHGSERLRQNR